ncbi:hypothetical protein AAFW58_005101, partial [Salmonella enterica]
MFKKIVSFLAVPASMAVSGATFAAEGAASGGVDLSPLTNSIDFSTVLVAIMAVAASLVTLYAGVAGVRWVL